MLISLRLADENVLVLAGHVVPQRCSVGVPVDDAVFGDSGVGIGAAGLTVVPGAVVERLQRLAPVKSPLAQHVRPSDPHSVGNL